jgi:hypothetical protein
MGPYNDMSNDKGSQVATSRGSHTRAMNKYGRRFRD